MKVEDAIAILQRQLDEGYIKADDHVFVLRGEDYLYPQCEPLVRLDQYLQDPDFRSWVRDKALELINEWVVKKKIQPVDFVWNRWLEVAELHPTGQTYENGRCT